MTFKLVSPAKVNLYLQVLRKRNDGYHEIETLFERISLADEMTFRSAASGIRLKSSSKSLPTGRGNIVYRAAELLKKKYRVRKGAVIGLKKVIPVSAGLGGGSSNAATALIGLNRLWRLGLSRKTLLRLGNELGSDVSFFLMRTPFATGRGRGEKLRKLKVPSSLRLWHCVVKPPFGISTKKAYAALKISAKASLTPPKPDAKMLLHSIQKSDPKPLSALCVNSLEAVINKRVTAILKIKKELVRCGASVSLMSGSGSAVFGVFSSRRHALRAAAFFKKNKGWRVFVARTF